jgi:predicted alpha/beta hydrolase family esterase
MPVNNASSAAGTEPLILLIPGLNNSGPDHWQTRWQEALPNTARVELGMWDNPHRNTWVNQLNLAIQGALQPVVLVAHSLGCATVAWWAEYERPGADHRVLGAMLVAPPDVDRPGLDPRLARFGACPRRELPFPSIVAASRNDPYCSSRTAISLARDWGSRFIDVGELGHVNARSHLGAWLQGQRLLNQLIGDSYGVSPRGKAASPGGASAVAQSRQPASR